MLLSVIVSVCATISVCQNSTLSASLRKRYKKMRPEQVHHDKSSTSNFFFHFFFFFSLTTKPNNELRFAGYPCVSELIHYGWQREDVNSSSKKAQHLSIWRKERPPLFTLSASGSFSSQSISLSVCLCLSMSVCLPVYVCQSVGRSVCLSVSVYVRQSVCLPVYLSVCFSMSDCLCLSIYVYLSVCRYVYLSVCLSVYVCLSVCLLICLPIRLFPIHIPIPQTDSTAQSKPNSIIFILKVRNTYTIKTEEKECVCIVEGPVL